MTPARFVAPARRRSAAGFTLVELMIAITIGLILTAAVITLFLGQRATYGFQESLSRVQENGRFAIQLMSTDLRHAGFFGCVRREQIESQLNPTTDPLFGLLFGPGAPPVIGWEHTNTGPNNHYQLGTPGNWASTSGIDMPSLGSQNGPLVPGSDVVVITRAQPIDAAVSDFQTSGANFHLDGPSGLPGRSIVVAVTGDCRGGDMWQKQNASNAGVISRGSGGNPGNVSPSGNPFEYLDHYDSNSQILSFVANAYYIAEQGSYSDEPALFRANLTPPVNGTDAQPVVEGVESMQVLYGIDTSEDRTANSYVTASEVPDWGRVVSVRISLLVRSPERSQTFSTLHDFNVGYTRITPTEAGRVRQVYSTTVGIRNRLP